MAKPKSRSVDRKDKKAMKVEKEMVLLHGYKYGMPKTDGTFNSNLYRWILNEHPIISICCADWSHPFGKCDRIMVLISTLSWSFMWAAIMESIFRGNDTATDTAKGLIISLITSIYEIYLVCLLTCPCVRRSSSRCLKCICCCIGYAVALQMLLYSLFWLLIGILIVYGSGIDDSFYGIWLGGEAASFLTWFLINVPLFYLRFESAKEKFQEEYPGFLNINGDLDPEFQGAEDQVYVSPFSDGQMSQVQLLNLSMQGNQTLSQHPSTVQQPAVNMTNTGEVLFIETKVPDEAPPGYDEQV
jgi:hypothetical protein